MTRPGSSSSSTMVFVGSPILSAVGCSPRIRTGSSASIGCWSAFHGGREVTRVPTATGGSSSRFLRVGRCGRSEQRASAMPHAGFRHRRQTSRGRFGRLSLPFCWLSKRGMLAEKSRQIQHRSQCDTSPTRRRRMARLSVNGQSYDLDVAPDTPLLWVLRENVGLTGTKYGCGISQCGACTVQINGEAVRSCSLPVSEAVGKQITTIEGLAQNGVLHKVQKAWIEHDVPQCGYCQSGMIMAVAALLKSKPKPTDADINENITNICRCGTFQQVREAIHAAASA